MGALENARAYIGATYGPTYAAWIALDDTTASQTLVAATRYIDRLAWKGTATGVLNGAPTFLQWPRSGVFIDGVAIDSTTVPTDITNACFELAVLILADPDLITRLEQGSNISSVGAGGGVSVSFFQQTSVRSGTATRLPYVVQQLVGKYLATPSDASEGSAGVGNCSSAFDSTSSFTLTRP
ncbi:MAG TPA: DnaT-like ssDNA-binding protein [Kofleriaceae bacterium]|nr:DnaT-like ssDNA-binding protein [Kofleriaceae bacterium]